MASRTQRALPPTRRTSGSTSTRPSGLDAAEQRCGARCSRRQSRHGARVLLELAREAKEHLSEQAFDAARSAAAVMAMNNIYYRSKHLLTDEGRRLRGHPARLRMQVIAPWWRGPGGLRFCASRERGERLRGCLASHERALRELGVGRTRSRGTQDRFGGPRSVRHARSRGTTAKDVSARSTDERHTVRAPGSQVDLASATCSSGWCAIATSPGPKTTVGHPAASYHAASVANRIPGRGSVTGRPMSARTSVRTFSSGPLPTLEGGKATVRDSSQSSRALGPEPGEQKPNCSSTCSRSRWAALFCRV